MDVGAYLKAPIPRWAAIAGVVLVSGSTALLTKRYVEGKLGEEYELRLLREMEVTKQFYKAVKKDEYPTPKDAVEALYPVEEQVKDLVEEAGYSLQEETLKEIKDDLTEVSTNVFTNADSSVWDQDAEEAQRDPSKPYIIEHDEYYENTSAWNSATLTYFTEDGVLSDEKDEHIPDIDGVVGEENLTKFGHGSRDPNILYVRNDVIEMMFEIVKAEGKYTEQVLGFVQHDDRRHARKFHLNEE